jgi:hypothetical protein
MHAVMTQSCCKCDLFEGCLFVISIVLAVCVRLCCLRQAVARLVFTLPDDSIRGVLPLLLDPFHTSIMAPASTAHEQVRDFAVCMWLSM